MKYKEFLDKLLKEISNTEKTLEPRIHKIEKNNGEILDGLVITKEGSYASPIIYIKEYYEENKKDNDLNQCITQILNVYNQAARKVNVSFSEISYWQFVKEKIRPMLINYHMNKQTLLNMPHEKYMDLAIIFYIDLSDSIDEYSSIKVTSKLMEVWGISVNQLRQTAYANMNHFDSPIIEKMDHVKKATYASFIRKNNLGKEWLEDIYILSNKKKFRGSCGILCNDVLKKFTEERNKGFYLLPSSIHETLLIPYEECYEMEKLTKLLVEFQVEEIAPEEVLSNKVYYFHNSLIK